MENKINIAELLEGCPKGMELYSPIFGEVYLDKIRPHLGIVVTTDKEQGEFKEEFLYDGRYGMNGECMIFPSKNKTTWEGFVPPYKFKDGDILFAKSVYDWIFIYKESGNDVDLYKYVSIPHNCSYKFITYDDNPICHKKEVSEIRLATEEEKKKLFDTIKENGYKWNGETKSLEKLVEPKFKVGDMIIKRDSIENSWIVSSVSSEYYGLQLPEGYVGIGVLPVADQDDWELVSNKFDITTLKPFDKVLVRGNVDGIWFPCFFGGLSNNNDDCPYMVVGGIRWKYCIPYEGNEHLLGKTDDCDEFYKNW